MPNDFDAVEKTFTEIKRLTAADPFEPFRLSVGGREIAVDHPNCIGFHPEVPYLSIHTREDIFRIAVEYVDLIREAHTP